jgi:hypothetical protein
MIAESVFHAATEYPRKAGNAIYVTSIGSQIGGAGAKEDEGS